MIQAKGCASRELHRLGANERTHARAPVLVRGELRCPFVPRRCSQLEVTLFTTSVESNLKCQGFDDFARTAVAGSGRFVCQARDLTTL